MKKNITHIHSLLLLPLVIPFSLSAMEDHAITLAILSHEKKNNFEESILMPPIPTTRGLGFVRSCKDLIWHEEENIYAELENKQLDLNNSSYHRKIDTAVEIYSSTRKNSDRLTNMLALCRQEPYKGKIKINDTSSCMAHTCLVQENKTQQMDLKNSIEIQDRKFIDEYNALIAELQDTVTKKITTIATVVNQHLIERDNIIHGKGEEIRVLKKGLIDLHHLNKTFKLPEDKTTDGYCSDDEKDSNNVKNSYNNQHLLEKNNMVYAMEQTKTNTKNVLRLLHEIRNSLAQIDPVQYKG
ncbi:MAG TPA: hypothetical protein VHX42_00215 [Candidatus Babeliales bacterium]|jgi:hypothetical protein|nr:hypothetical protein [Candidatus Babeliales bacterium]